MSTHLDHLDIQILEILQQDSTIAIKEIAKQIGLSATPTYERIKGLEKDGYINKYVALVNRDKINLGILVYCNITLKDQTKDAILKFEQAITTLPEIMEVLGLSGNYDYLLKIVSKDIFSYNEFLLNKFSSIPNVAQFHSSIILSEVKKETAFPLNHLKK